LCEAMEKFREGPTPKNRRRAPADGGKFFAVRGFGDFRQLGFGAVIAHKIIVIQRLGASVYRNDGRAVAVESKCKNLLRGKRTEFPDDLASCGRQGDA